MKLHGFTAAYGGMIRFMGLDRESRERSYRQVWREISEGAFADALHGEVDSGFPSQAILDEMVEGDNSINRAEKRLRGMMRLGNASEDGG